MGPRFETTTSGSAPTSAESARPVAERDVDRHLALPRSTVNVTV